MPSIGDFHVGSAYLKRHTSFGWPYCQRAGTEPARPSISDSLPHVRECPERHITVTVLLRTHVLLALVGTGWVYCEKNGKRRTTCRNGNNLNVVCSSTYQRAHPQSCPTRPGREKERWLSREVSDISTINALEYVSGRRQRIECAVDRHRKPEYSVAPLSSACDQWLESPTYGALMTT